MAKIFEFPKQSKAEKFMDDVNPESVADHLLDNNPDLNPRIVSAMSLAMVYAVYLSMVCEEENLDTKELFETTESIWPFYDEENIH